MIFVGDIALPYPNAITVELPATLQNKQWVANFEGAAIDNTSGCSDKWIVYNDKQSIELLSKVHNFAGFALANNHIVDCGTLADTVSFLEDINVPYCGIGKCLEDSSKTLTIHEGAKKINILNFGWEVIQCKVSSKDRGGVNPLTREHVVKSFNVAQQKEPNIPIVVFFHWNYELEAYPNPFERELAMYLIDNGAIGIIGCHSHRVGGFELYKNRPIVYSLGNWLFLQGFYHRGKISFPSFSHLELAFEWNFEKSEFFFHFFEYDKNHSRLRFLRTEDVTSQTMKELTPFRSMNKEEYKKWYKINRFHKNKGLPIYYFEDSVHTIRFKNFINRLRHILVVTVVKLGFK